jgi:aspartate oxidase
MHPLVLAGIASGVGALGSGWLGARGAHSANRMAAESVEKQMAFQERMANTAYQRQMADMRKAGLNPILAAGFGGASVPPGASYSPQNELQGAASSAMDYLRMKAELANAREMTKQIATQSDLNKANAEAARASALQSTSTAQNIASQTPREQVKSEGWKAAQRGISTAKEVIPAFRTQVREFFQGLMQSAKDKREKFGRK